MFIDIQEICKRGLYVSVYSNGSPFGTVFQFQANVNQPEQQLF